MMNNPLNLSDQNDQATDSSTPSEEAQVITWSERITAYEKLMRLDKPIGILLLLFPTLIAIWVSGYRVPSAMVVFLFVAGTILMRSAGCVINDLWDRNYDGKVWRTQDRPLATGKVKPIEALVIALILLIVAFFIVLEFHNPIAYALAIASVVITILYPLMKRWIYAPQAVLGIAFSMGIPMAFAVQLQNFPSSFWWFFALNFFYVMAYDTSYAMADREDDKLLGLKSTAIWFGRADVLIIMLCYAIYGIGMIALLFDIGWSQYLFWQCLGFIVFMVDQWLLLRDRVPASCFKAFRRAFWLSLVLWLSLIKAPYFLF